MTKKGFLTGMTSLGFLPLESRIPKQPIPRPAKSVLRSDLSKDAIIFGLCYLNGPKKKLSFGGDGAGMAITPRARDALTELIEAGYAEVAAADDQIPNREHYRGTMANPSLGGLALSKQIDPFGDDAAWPTFVATKNN